MSDIKLGKLIEKTGEERDAIHIAIAPMVAAHELAPADHVGILEDGRAGGCDKPIGIVDPFLKDSVREGQSFWLCLYQGTVTGMKHHWVHPAFEENSVKSVKSISETWIRNYADEIRVPYARLMDAARVYITSEEYLCEGDLLEGVSTEPEFWVHYKNVTGKCGSGNFFSCSC